MMNKITGISLLLTGLALTGCSESNAQVKDTPSHSHQKVVKTVKKTVTGEWIGRTLLPRSGETRAQYEERLAFLNDMDKRLERDKDFKPRLSIFTEEGVNMYTWARRLEQTNKTGNPDDFNPKKDIYLLMAKQMKQGGTTYISKVKTSSSSQKSSKIPNARQGRSYDF